MGDQVQTAVQRRWFQISILHWSGRKGDIPYHCISFSAVSRQKLSHCSLLDTAYFLINGPVSRNLSKVKSESSHQIEWKKKWHRKTLKEPEAQITQQILKKAPKYGSQLKRILIGVFLKLVSLTNFQSSFLLFVEFDKMPYEVNLIVQVEFLSE